MPITRHLIFRSNDLGVDATLLLTFDSAPQMEGLYKSVKPTAWKVTAFGKEGGYTLTATYTSQLGFTRAQAAGGVVVPASTYIPINPGQVTTLTKDGDPGIYRFSKPEALEENLGSYMRAMNKTGTAEDIGFGFFENSKRPLTTVNFYPDVKNDYDVPVDGFTPVLSAYITKPVYEENQILEHPVNNPPIWTRDLTTLDETTYWLLTYTDNVFKITSDDSSV